MKNKIFIVLLTVVCVLFSFAPNTNAATQAEIETAIGNGLAYLASHQSPDGSWTLVGSPFAEYDVATTGLAVLKFEERAKELGKDPFNPSEYEYANNVIKGLDYIFTYATSDANGVHFFPFFHDVYNTGITMMAVAASNAPGRIITTGALTGWNYKDALQGMMNWMAFAQNTGGCEIGGWGYEGPYSGWSDNSNSGYASLGIGFANAPAPKGFGLAMPVGVLSGLDIFATNVQVTAGGYIGGSIYNPCWLPPLGQMVNTLKTGNLLYELALTGKGTGDPKVGSAVAFIENFWNIPAGICDGCGWMGDYQAAFTMMKGLESLGIKELTVGGNPTDWFDVVSTYIVTNQNPDGSWTSITGETVGLANIDTAWAMLTLERVVPQVFKKVFVDIKPGSCPNPLNVTSKGVQPVAVMGTADFDVTTIDPATIRLTREGFEDVGVAPLRWAYEDVATPFEGQLCGCHALNGDGLMDLTLKFDTQALVNALKLGDVSGQTIKLTLTGKLREEFGGTPIKGEDCTRVK